MPHGSEDLFANDVPNFELVLTKSNFCQNGRIMMALKSKPEG